MKSGISILPTRLPLIGHSPGDIESCWRSTMTDLNHGVGTTTLLWSLLFCACGGNNGPSRTTEPNVVDPSPVAFKAVDLSRSRYFPPFANQGQVASCDWFACAYYQESGSAQEANALPVSFSGDERYYFIHYARN